MTDPNPEIDADGERCIDTACTVAGWIAFALVVLGCALAVRYCPDLTIPFN